MALAVGAGFVLTMPIASLAARGEVVTEHGPAESIQLASWLVAATLAWTLAATGITRRDGRGRWLLVSIGSLALLAALRESDIMQNVRPDRVGGWGVRFVWDWWLSADAPVLPRLVYGLLMLAIALSIAVPIIRCEIKPVRELLRGHPGIWLLGVTAVLGGIAAVADKLLGDAETGALLWFEEVLETVGVATFIGAVLGFARPVDDS